MSSTVLKIGYMTTRMCFINPLLWGDNYQEKITLDKDLSDHYKNRIYCTDLHSYREHIKDENRVQRLGLVVDRINVQFTPISSIIKYFIIHGIENLDDYGFPMNIIGRKRCGDIENFNIKEVEHKIIHFSSKKQGRLDTLIADAQIIKNQEGLIKFIEKNFSKIHHTQIF